MRTTLPTLVLALATSPLTMNSQTLPDVVVRVPADLTDVDGPDMSRFPFGYPAQPAFGIPERPVRYQQVYDASAFTQLPPGGAFVTRMFFRSDCGVSWGPLVTNLQVSLSTTARRPDELSANFTENIGPDETIVARLRMNYAPPGNYHPSCPTPQPPSEVPLELPFWYDPARGNLLLDMRVSGVTPYPDDELPPTWWRFAGEEENWPHNKLDAVSTAGDAISRAAAFSLESSTAEVLDTTGLWTMFQFSPLPALGVLYETNTVVLSWPIWPQAFRLQSAESLDAGTAWQNYSGQPAVLGYYYYVELPRATLASGRFYRLTLDTPQLVNGPSASAPVFLEPNKVP
jgi:hypothetical protein